MKITWFYLSFIFLMASSVNLWSEIDWQTMLDEPIIISLGRCMHRYDETYRLMEEAGFTNIQRFEAIDASCTSDEFFEDLGIFSGFKGQKGIAASHLLIWKSFLEDNITDKEYLFVCEDDMLPHTDFYSIFPIYWDATPKDFDIVMVGNNMCGKLKQKKLVISNPTYTMHAYIISKKGAKKLLHLYSKISLKNKQKEPHAIDHFTYNLMKNHHIIYYCYNGKKFPDFYNIKNKRIWPNRDSGICFQNFTLPSTKPRPKKY